MYLQEVVTICAGTKLRFRRPGWAKGFSVEVLAEDKEFESAYGDTTIAITDLCMREPSSSDWPFCPDTSDILADDYILTKEGPCLSSP